MGGLRFRHVLNAMVLEERILSVTLVSLKCTQEPVSESQRENGVGQVQGDAMGASVYYIHSTHS